MKLKMSLMMIFKLILHIPQESMKLSEKDIEPDKQEKLGRLKLLCMVVIMNSLLWIKLKNTLIKEISKL